MSLSLSDSLHPSPPSLALPRPALSEGASPLSPTLSRLLGVHRGVCILRPLQDAENWGGGNIQFQGISILYDAIQSKDLSSLVICRS